MFEDKRKILYFKKAKMHNFHICQFYKISLLFFYHFQQLKYFLSLLINVFRTFLTLIYYSRIPINKQ